MLPDVLRFAVDERIHRFAKAQFKTLGNHIGTAGAEYEDLAEPVTAIVADGADVMPSIDDEERMWVTGAANVARHLIPNSPDLLGRIPAGPSRNGRQPG